jgi:hypothetical protein
MTHWRIALLLLSLVLVPLAAGAAPAGKVAIAPRHPRPTRAEREVSKSGGSLHGGRLSRATGPVAGS